MSVGNSLNGKPDAICASAGCDATSNGRNGRLNGWLPTIPASRPINVFLYGVWNHHRDVWFHRVVKTAPRAHRMPFGRPAGGPQGDVFGLGDSKENKGADSRPTSGGDEDRTVGSALRSVYQQTVDEKIPGDLLDLLGKLS